MTWSFNILTLLFHFAVVLFSQHGPYCSKDEVWGLQLHPRMKRSQHCGAGKLSLNSPPQQACFFIVLIFKSHFPKLKQHHLTSAVESLHRFKQCCTCRLLVVHRVLGSPQAPLLDALADSRCHTHDTIRSHRPLITGLQVAKMTTA